MPRRTSLGESPAFIAARMALHARAQLAREAEARLVCTDPTDRMICEGLGSDDRALVAQLVAAGTHDLDAAIAHAWTTPGERWISRGTALRGRERD